jgi:hypothetical protein
VQRTVLAVVLFALAMAGAPRSAAPPTIANLLDRYSRGDFAGAVDAAASVDVSQWRGAFTKDAGAWIAREPRNAAKRRLAAAGFIVELAKARYETDYHVWSQLDESIEWICAQLRLSPVPVSGERAWQLASTALAERVRDTTWLIGPRVRGIVTPLHLEHAALRFPDDKRLKLQRIVLHTLDADKDLQLQTALASLQGRAGMQTRLTNRLDAAIHEYDPFIGDGDVGADAEVHVSHLYLEAHAFALALDHARTAATGVEPTTRYLAHMVAGQALIHLHRPEDASRELTEALDILPNGQSAALALSSLLLLAGDPWQADELATRSLPGRPGADDPWRLYYYGEFVRWPAIMADLHRALR